MKKLLILTIIITGFSFNVVSAEQNKYKLKPILSNIKNPWGVAVLNENEFLITTKPGLLIHFNNGRKRIFDLNKVIPIFKNGQGGLLDIILSPDFKQNKEFYISFSMKKGKGGVTAVAKAEFSGNPPSPKNWKIIFKGNNYSTNGFHFGSRLAIDRDNLLYISIGDRRDRKKIQSLRFHNGKTVRITTDGKAPKSNPFYYRENALKDIYTLGHRNSQGIVFDFKKNILYQSEHGPKGGDEINIIKPGVNYGWPVITYGKEYSGRPVGKGLTNKRGMQQPLINWTPSIAPSGLAYYNGNKFSEFKNTLITGALSGKHIRIIFLNSGEMRQKTIFKGRARIRDVRTDNSGNIYILTDGKSAGLYQLERK